MLCYHGYKALFGLKFLSKFVNHARQSTNQQAFEISWHFPVVCFRKKVNMSHVANEVNFADWNQHKYDMMVLPSRGGYSDLVWSRSAAAIKTH